MSRISHAGHRPCESKFFGGLSVVKLKSPCKRSWDRIRTHMGGLRGGSGPELAVLGRGSRRMWAVLGRSRGLCRRSWALLGPKLAVLEPKWSVLEAIGARSVSNPSGSRIQEAQARPTGRSPPRPPEESFQLIASLQRALNGRKPGLC